MQLNFDVYIERVYNVIRKNIYYYYYYYYCYYYYCYLFKYFASNKIVPLLFREENWSL